MEQEQPPQQQQQNGSVGSPPPPLQNDSVVESPPPPLPPQHGCVGDWEHRLRRYLLLLASLAATVTYAAGLDPPGGSWVESDGEMMAVAGDSILRTTNHPRYLAFYYSNATAFAASLVIILLLLVLPDKKDGPPEDKKQTTHLRVLRLVMVLDLLALMVAYTAGSCRDRFTRLYTGVLVVALSSYVGYHFLEALCDKDNGNVPNGNASGAPDLEQVEQLRKVLMLLAIFAATITYNAGLNPPGGFWEHNDGLHRPGEVVLKHKHGSRFTVFFFCNTSAFIASLLTVVLLLNKKLMVSAERRQQHLFLYGFFVVSTLVTLVTAYAAGSCRNTASTTYTVALIAAVLLSIFLVALATCIATLLRKPYIRTLLTKCLKGNNGDEENGGDGDGGDGTARVQDNNRLDGPARDRDEENGGDGGGTDGPARVEPLQDNSRLDGPARDGDGPLHENGMDGPAGDRYGPLQEMISLVLLLATLAASITYQAGLNPPGGVWLQNQSGHNAGDPILLSTDNKRYMILFYCNSTALVASIVAILMVEIEALLKPKALQAAIMFNLLGLMGAYIAGSSRTLRASVYLISLAAAFLVYVTVIYLIPTTVAPSTSSEQEPQQNPAQTTASTSTTTTTTTTITPNNSQTPNAERDLKKRRKRLLLSAILMAAITYQAGLSPPGGFWRVDQGHSSAGSPILEVMYPRRYQAFFYCNAMSFMASMALIILLQDKNTYQRAGIRFYGLYACMLVGMLVLMGAYAAGTARRVKTSIYVFILVGGVIGFIAVLFPLYLCGQKHDEKAARSPASSPAPTTPRSRQPSNANGGGGDSHPDRQSSQANDGRTAGDDDNHLDPQSSAANPNDRGTAENNDDNHHRHAKRKYVMLLAMLAASVTYQAGLDPPGGVWPEGYAAGSPVLHDSNLRRYHVFFYSNSSSFMASIVVIILLLQSEWLNMTKKNRRQKMLLTATQTVIALDLVGLLVAYAAGSCRTFKTSMCVILLVVVVVIYIILVHVSGVRLCAVGPGAGGGTSNTQAFSPEPRRNAANGNEQTGGLELYNDAPPLQAVL